MIVRVAPGGSVAEVAREGRRAVPGVRDERQAGGRRVGERDADGIRRPRIRDGDRVDDIGPGHGGGGPRLGDLQSRRRASAAPNWSPCCWSVSASTAPAGAATVAVLTSEPVAFAAIRPVTVNVARSPASSVTVVARLPVPEAAAQLDPASATQVHAGATSATGNSVGHARGGHRTRPGVGHHDRVGRRQSRYRGAGQASW